MISGSDLVVCFFHPLRGGSTQWHYCTLQYAFRGTGPCAKSNEKNMQHHPLYVARKSHHGIKMVCPGIFDVDLHGLRHSDGWFPSKEHLENTTSKDPFRRMSLSFVFFQTQVDVLLGITKDDGSETVMEEALAEAPKVMASRVARKVQDLKVLTSRTQRTLVHFLGKQC